MTPDDFNKNELQACRKLLMLEVKEAAVLVAGHSNPRTWQRYEDGTRKIPKNIAEAVKKLVEKKNRLMKSLTTKQVNLQKEGKVLRVEYYHAFEEWLKKNPGTNQIDWRIHQSAAASVFSASDNVELI